MIKTHIQKGCCLSFLLLKEKHLILAVKMFATRFLCTDSQSLLLLDFANKKNGKPSGNLRDCLYVCISSLHIRVLISDFTSRGAHATGFSVKGVSGPHTPLQASAKAGHGFQGRCPQSQLAGWLDWHVPREGH